MSEVINISIKRLQVSKFNVRMEIGDLTPLIESIKQNGILEPIIVRPVRDFYEVIAGRRRFEAAKTAGLLEVPCIVKDLSDEDAIIFSTTENLQRENLSEMEIAEAYYKFKEVNPEAKPEDFADKIGISRTWLLDIITAYSIAKPLIQKGVIKDFKSNPNPEDKDVITVSHLKEIAYAVKDLPLEKKEKEAESLVKMTMNMPIDVARDVISKFKETGEAVDKVVTKVSTERREREEEAGREETKPKKPGMMKIVDPEHSIVDYLDYFITMLKRFRGDGKKIDRIIAKNNSIVVKFSGYRIPSYFSISLRHGERTDGKDMVLIYVREDLRDLIEFIKGDIDSPEPKYFAKKEEKESGGEKEILYTPIALKPRKRIIWRLRDEVRQRVQDIYYRLDKDGRRIFSLLAQFPYGVCEEEILLELRNAGYNKEDAYNIMLEKKEEFLDEEWIEVEE